MNRQHLNIKYEPACDTWLSGEIEFRLTITEAEKSVKITKVTVSGGLFSEQLVSGAVLENRAKRFADSIGATFDPGFSQRYWRNLASSDQEITEANETAASRGLIK